MAQILPHLEGKGSYTFVLNAPCSHIDAYGLFVTEEGIDSGQYVYTCNCGWLDSSHYSGYVDKYMAVYNAMRQNTRGSIVLNSEIQYNIDIGRTYTWDFTGVANIDYFAQAMKLLFSAAQQEETDQGRRAGFGLVGNWTAFAYEDIPSDMFGGLIAKLMLRDGFSYAQALQKAMEGCHPVTDKTVLKRLYRANRQALSSGTTRGARQSPMTCDPCDRMMFVPYAEWNEIVGMTNPTP